MELAVSEIFILVHTWLVWIISTAAASSCTSDQVHRCMDAALQDDIESLSEGGICKPSKYVNYTHQCGILSYLPSADFCCCTYDEHIFCCRYHYDWNYYRCNENEDTIYHMGDLPLPLEILLPTTVLSSMSLLCFIFYCVKCCCCNDDDNDDDPGGCCYIRCGCRKKRRMQEKSSPGHGNQYTMVPDYQHNNDVTPEIVPEHCEVLCANKQSFINKKSVKQPTAPPYDMACHMGPPIYNPAFYSSHNLSSNGNQVYSPYISPHLGIDNSIKYKPVLTETEISLPITKLIRRDCELDDKSTEQDRI